jgi:hypothetical protein
MRASSSPLPCCAFGILKLTRKHAFVMGIGIVFWCSIFAQHNQRFLSTDLFSRSIATTSGPSHSNETIAALVPRVDDAAVDAPRSRSHFSSSLFVTLAERGLNIINPVSGCSLVAWVYTDPQIHLLRNGKRHECNNPHPSQVLTVDTVRDVRENDTVYFNHLAVAPFTAEILPHLNVTVVLLVGQYWLTHSREAFPGWTSILDSPYVRKVYSHNIDHFFPSVATTPVPGSSHKKKKPKSSSPRWSGTKGRSKALPRKKSFVPSNVKSIASLEVKTNASLEVKSIVSPRRRLQESFPEDGTQPPPSRSNPHQLRDHPKLAPWPFGIKHLAYNHPNEAHLELYETAFWKHLCGGTNKTKGVMRGFINVHTNIVARSNVPSSANITSMWRYLEDLAEHQFVLSPNGDRPECFRHYEAIGLGTIPITGMSRKYYHHLENAPVLYNTTNWHLNATEAIARLGGTATTHRDGKIPEANRIMILEEYWMEYVERDLGGSYKLRWFDRLQARKARLEDFLLLNAMDGTTYGHPPPTKDGVCRHNHKFLWSSYNRSY